MITRDLVPSGSHSVKEIWSSDDKDELIAAGEDFCAKWGYAYGPIVSTPYEVEGGFEMAVSRYRSCE